MTTDLQTHQTSTTPTSRMDPMRKTALAAGLLYIATFVFSIPALALYHGVLKDPAFVLGAGSDQGVLWGGLIEIITALAGIGTAVVLYPVVKRYSATRAQGFIASRSIEAAMIMVGVLAVLSVFTLRHDLAGGTGADAASASAVAHGLVAIKNWSFLIGPGLMPAINALCLATVMHRSRLVPRIIPTLGLIGAPLLVVSSTATLFGAWDQVSAAAFLFALPIAAWEFSLGVWMTVKGFRTPTTASGETTVPDAAPAFSTAA